MGGVTDSLEFDEDDILIALDAMPDPGCRFAAISNLAVIAVSDGNAGMTSSGVETAASSTTSALAAVWCNVENETALPRPTSDGQPKTTIDVSCPHASTFPALSDSDCGLQSRSDSYLGLFERTSRGAMLARSCSTSSIRRASFSPRVNRTQDDQLSPAARNAISESGALRPMSVHALCSSPWPRQEVAQRIDSSLHREERAGSWRGQCFGGSRSSGSPTSSGNRSRCVKKDGLVDASRVPQLRNANRGGLQSPCSPHSRLQHLSHDRLVPKCLTAVSDDEPKTPSHASVRTQSAYQTRRRIAMQAATQRLGPTRASRSRHGTPAPSHTVAQSSSVARSSTSRPPGAQDHGVPTGPAPHSLQREGDDLRSCHSRRIPRPTQAGRRRGSRQEAPDELVLYLNAVRRAAEEAPMILEGGVPALEVCVLCEDIHDSCAICLDMMTARQRVAELPCKHRYHYRCIAVWLPESHTCPLCKQHVGA